ncbi:MAG: NAD(P)H-dependent oxidoreductase [Clostridiales bacterium]|nr:NAD(P)H-dependent oxidoreductase [Clostridiales bacterium]
MNVCSVVAVSNSGCTDRIREAFLDQLNRLIPGVKISQFTLPKDGPAYCLGCKACFFKDMSACPHLKATLPIWQAMEDADLVVFITPTYVFSIPGQLKALLDHFGSRWIVHQPSPQMLGKQALIINQAVGAGFRSTLRPLKHSLRFWGVRRVYSIRARLGMTDYDLVNQKVKTKLNRQIEETIRKIVARQQDASPGFLAKLLYRAMAFGQRGICKMLQKKGQPVTSDYLYWQKAGWLEGRFPWKGKA